MPRVTFVKKARKDNSVCKRGESYYWWKFRYGGKRYSLTAPRPSQLTQSPYYSTIRSASESVSDWFAENHETTEVDDFRNEIVAVVEDAADECQESLDNMPESLQQGPTGELLQERIEVCEAAASDLGGIDCDFETSIDEEDDPDEEESADELEDWMMEKEGEITEFIDSCEV